jgi:hypothetical protein
VRPRIVLGTNLVVGTLALGWVLWTYGGSAFGLLTRDPRPGWLLGAAAVVAVAFVGWALRWRILLEGLDAPRPLARLVGYRAAGQSLSNLVPSAKLGGEPLRAYLLVRDGVSAPTSIASVAVDRALDMGAGAPFAFLYATILLRWGVPELQGAFVSVTLGIVALSLGLVVAARRLRTGAGLVTAVARSTGLDRMGAVQGRMDVLAAAEADAARLVARPRRLWRAFMVGIGVNGLVLVEYWLLLGAFGLPADAIAVVAAIFATGAAHSLPVPGSIGALEGAQLWLFTTLGYPPEIGLAVGLAVRLREIVWVLPGLVYLAVRGLAHPGWERSAGLTEASARR